MRIAVWHNLPSGGAKRALFQHVKGLVALGHTVESWTLETADQSYLPLRELVPEHVVPFSYDVVTPATQIRRLLGTSNAERRLERMHDACAQCAREMRERGMEVVYAGSSRTFLVPFIGLHTELPVVGYVQEPNRELYEADHRGEGTLPWVADAPRTGVVARLKQMVVREVLALLAREEWAAVRALDGLLVNSRFSRESFMRAYGVDSKVCYLGIDTAQFRDLGLPRERVILGLGSFHAAKGIDLAIRAVSLLPEPRPALEWIGNADSVGYLAEMSALAASLGVDFRPRLRVEDAVILDRLNRAMLMIYTSKLEPFGYAPLEANACGTPVVAVAEGGVRETIIDGENGLLVDDRDPEALAAAVRRLLDDPALARALGSRGVAVVGQRWTVEESVRRVERHLVRTLEGSRGVSVVA